MALWALVVVIRLPTIRALHSSIGARLYVALTTQCRLLLLAGSGATGIGSMLVLKEIQLSN